MGFEGGLDAKTMLGCSVFFCSHHWLLVLVAILLSLV